MSKKLLRAVKQQKKQTEPSKLQILGTLGVPLGGQRLVEVPNRNSFVYVQLRSNQNEVIQAFNNQVSPSYGLPVIVQREGNRYIILGVDTQRYQNNWNSFSSYLPRHGNTHSFEPETGGGGDITFVFSRQFMPLLSIPSGSQGGPNVIISPYTLKMDNGTWKYVGNTGTASLLQYVPTGSNAVMVLVYIDADTGNPGLVVGSGAYFANTITGAAEVVPYIPQISNPNWIPDAAIRLVTGTSIINWDNIYDVRQFLRYAPTGTSMFIQNNGATLGDASILNFIMYGANNISVSGTTARIFVSGSGGGSASINTGTLDARYLKINTDNDPLTGPLQIIPTGAFRNALYAESDADDIVGDFEQLPTTNGNINEPVMFLYRGPFGANSPFFTDQIIQARTDNPPTGTNAGGLLKYFVNGDSDAELITSINPHLAGTGNAAMFDTTTVFQWNGNLLLLKNAGSSRFYVNASGTAYSNEQALIKEAPFNSGTYVRKNNGWETLPSDISVLSSNISLTGTAGTYQDTGLTVTLPSLGRYKISCDCRGQMVGGSGSIWWIHAKLFNATDALDLSNTETLVVLTATTGLQLQTTAPINTIIDVNGSKSIRLYAARNGVGSPTWTASDIPSDVNGRTRLMYEKIG